MDDRKWWFLLLPLLRWRRPNDSRNARGKKKEGSLISADSNLDEAQGSEFDDGDCQRQHHD